MFVNLSKIGWFFLQPSNALILMAVAGTLLWATSRFASAGRILVVTGIGGLAIFAFSPIGNLAVLPLEERFPAWNEANGAPDGIILLGGSFVTGISQARGSVELNEAGERLTAFISLARHYPEARLVFSGGAGAGASEDQLAALLFDAVGLPPDRVEFEGRSLNTWQNAQFTREMISPAADTRWLLVTSAWHMPRAVGSFRRAGLPVEAYPVDYRTRGWKDALRPFNSASEGLRRTDVAVREWIGLIAYRLSGRSEAFLPAP